MFLGMWTCSTLFAGSDSKFRLFADRDGAFGSCVNLPIYYFNPGLGVCQFSVSLTTDQFNGMDHRDLLELRRTLRTCEGMVQGNRASILTLITKFNEYKQQCIAQIAEIMSTLLQVKQQLPIFKTECNLLSNLVENLNREAHSMASNQRMSEQGENNDEDTAIQMRKVMDIGKQEPDCTDTGLEEQQVITPSFSLCFLK